MSALFSDKSSLFRKLVEITIVALVFTVVLVKKNDFERSQDYANFVAGLLKKYSNSKTQIIESDQADILVASTTTRTRPNTTITIHKTDIPILKLKQCKSMLTEGKWVKWTDSGFSRSVTLDNGEVISVRDPLHPKYPDAPPPFLEWTKQNYSGVWGSTTNCELLTFHESEVQKCFNPSNRITIVGDSRTRHIFRTLSFILQGTDQENDVWFDTKIPNTKEVKFENQPFLKFWWSGSFDSNILEKIKGHKSNQASKLAPRIVEALNDQSQNTSLFIIGEHLLHPLLHYTHGTGVIGNKYDLDVIDSDFWVKTEVVNPIKTEIMPKIVNTLLEKPWLKVMFLGCGYTIHFPMWDNLRLHTPNKQLFMRHYCDQYNLELGNLIQKVVGENSDFKNRLLWFPAVTNIGQSPDGIPLAVDGVHFNWVEADISRGFTHWKKTFPGWDGKLNISSVHRSIADVILNVACFENKSILSKNHKHKNFCCY